MNNVAIKEDGVMRSLGWVKIDKFLAEYNPKRYDLYSSLFASTFNDEQIRNMYLSPMYEFILSYNLHKVSGEKFDNINTRYYKMQKLYGKTHSFAVLKMSHFVKLFKDIEKNSLKTPPLVLPEENGDLVQIKDGHHRIACCMVLGYKKIICDVIRGQM